MLRKAAEHRAIDETDSSDPAVDRRDLANHVVAVDDVADSGSASFAGSFGSQPCSLFNRQFGGRGNPADLGGYV